MFSSPKLRFFIVSFVGSVLLDQTSKFSAARYHLILINHGVSFNYGEHLPPFALQIVLLTVLVVVMLIARDFWQRYPWIAGIFFGAAVSNVVDRWFFGGVRDWISLPFVTVKNNIADIIIFSVIVYVFFLECWQRICAKE